MSTVKVTSLLCCMKNRSSKEIVLEIVTMCSRVVWCKESITIMDTVHVCEKIN